MDFYSAMDQDGWYYLRWMDAKGEVIGHIYIAYSYMTEVVIDGKAVARKEVPKLAKGRHTMRIMATKSTIKCYIDQERIANVPKVEGFAPVGFSIDIDPYFEGSQACRIGTFRYAEGGKSMREQLDESGRIVTHGILFDSGSDRIKAESMKTLTDIGTMLTEDAALRLSIEGHTDADGADADNLKLSQARASSVRTYLMENFKIDGARLEAQGFGEAKPIDVNTSPEGKANNRRVELVKL
jgi:outer membrane protein OmpA-like peptidoglycan-associated protein